MNPVVSYSSRLTTALLQFRNPYGSEENWIARSRSIDNYMIHVGKVLITEVALLPLLGLSLAESFVYGLSFTACLSVSLLAMGICRFANHRFDFILEPCRRATLATLKVSQSADFTWRWNVGNLLIYNIFDTHVMTRESLARIDMNHQNSTMRARSWTILIVGAVALGVGFSVMGFAVSLPALIVRMNGIALLFPAGAPIREEDRDYRDAFLLNANIPLNWVTRWGGTREASEGQRFFDEAMMNAPELSDATKKAISYMASEVINFVLARTVYLYAFGSKRNATLPSFLKDETRQQIRTLRQNRTLKQAAINGLKLFMEDPVKFEHPDEATGEDGPIAPDSRVLFIRLKTIAAREVQGGEFFNECWAPSLIARQAAQAEAVAGEATA